MTMQSAGRGPCTIYSPRDIESYSYLDDRMWITSDAAPLRVDVGVYSEWNTLVVLGVAAWIGFSFLLCVKGWCGSKVPDENTDDEADATELVEAKHVEDKKAVPWESTDHISERSTAV